jgi:hypothetical protein
LAFRAFAPSRDRFREFEGAILMNTAIDPQRCPLCGADNHCAVARGKGTCWCFTSPISDDVLEKIPAEARERACVCQTCARGNRAPAEVMMRMQEILRRRNGSS